MVNNREAQLILMLEESPNDSFIIYALALEWIKHNNFEKALEAFYSLAKNAPDYLATYLHFGNLLAQLNRIEEAKTIYEKGIEVALNQKNMKSKQEIEQALQMLDE